MLMKSSWPLARHTSPVTSCTDFRFGLDSVRHPSALRASKRLLQLSRRGCKVLKQLVTAFDISKGLNFK